MAVQGKLPVLLASLALAGCSVSPAYYWQAAGGQFEIFRRAVPLQEAAADPARAPQLRDQLRAAGEIRRFAVRELALPDRGFNSYADLDRPYVVWNVFAADPLSLRAKEWCVPVAGCIGYLGYFSQADAEAHAERLRAEGLDVHIGGVPAYSTLGWFKDPLLSTFIRWPETELARLLFHELAHQRVYVKDDSEFNESFASTVEEAGIRRWMAQPGKEGLLPGFERAQKVRAGFAALVREIRTELEEIYSSGLTPEAKRAAKAAAIARMRETYRLRKINDWAGYSGYDRWFETPINNAKLASVGLYSRWVPAFTALLASKNGDLPAFFAEVEHLAGEPPERRRAMLAALGSPPVAAVR